MLWDSLRDAGQDIPYINIILNKQYALRGAALDDLTETQVSIKCSGHARVDWNITPILQGSHWLLVPFHVHFKVQVVIYNVLHGQEL